MDLNLVVVCGTLYEQPKVFNVDGDTNLVRLKVRTETNEGVNIVSVDWSQVTDDELLAAHLLKDDRVWVAGYLYSAGFGSYLHASTVQRQDGTDNKEDD